MTGSGTNWRVSQAPYPTTRLLTPRNSASAEQRAWEGEAAEAKHWVGPFALWLVRGPSQASTKEPVSHSDQKQNCPPAGGGLPEQPDPVSHAAAFRQHLSASALRGPAR